MKRITLKNISGFLQMKSFFQLGWGIGCVLAFSLSAIGQTSIDQHEENFAFEVKQIDEFFERFNNQQTLIKEYIAQHYDQAEVKREDLIMSLFNRQSTSIEEADVHLFIESVNNPQKPVFLSFYDDDWFARVKCRVVFEQKERDLLLLLRVQKEVQGASRWIIQNVYADFLLISNEKDPGTFLNPVSHGTDFMGLNRAFQDPENLKAYLPENYQEDQLSKLVQELQNKRIVFRHVDEISYHFFQIDGWILTVENFQRQEKNSGWLISALVKASSKEKEIIKQKLLKQKI